MSDLHSFWWVPVLAALILFWSTQAAMSQRRIRLGADQLAAVTSLCGEYGLSRVEDAGAQFKPEMLPMVEPRFRSTFANSDWSLWCSEITDQKDGSVFWLMMFSAGGLNIPYVAVARKGAIALPAVGRGSDVQLESIDFADRFEVRADDRRAALMLVDQAFMQWLLDLNDVSFQITGPLVTGVVKKRGSGNHPPGDLELLFQFRDAFGAHIPQLILDEYPAPKELAAATIQALRSVSGLLSQAR